MSTNISRDLSVVKKAHKERNVELSRLAHERKPLNKLAKASEKHAKGGGYVKSMVYGGLDGIVTNCCYRAWYIFLDCRRTFDGRR